MVVKTYRGPRMSEVLNEIRKNHGESALILSVKEKRNGAIEVSVGIRNVRTDGERKLHAAMIDAQSSSTSKRLAWLTRRSLN